MGSRCLGAAVGLEKSCRLRYTCDEEIWVSLLVSIAFSFASGPGRLGVQWYRGPDVASPFEFYNLLKQAGIAVVLPSFSNDGSLMSANVIIIFYIEHEGRIRREECLVPYP